MKIDPDGFREKQASEKHHERAEKIKTHLSYQWVFSKWRPKSIDR